MMRKLVNYFILLFILIPSISLANMIHVVVNKGNPLKALTEQQVIDLYMGRLEYFPNGRIVVKIDAAGNSKLRESFYGKLVNMSVPEVNAYWARLLFSGRATPPMSVSNNDEVLQIVADNPNAIGYVDPVAAHDNRVKTVATIDITGLP
jgi:ABC-type phosphate transport system substrate-binding protein